MLLSALYFLYFAFLRLQKVMQGKTTVIFDTNVPPFDLLKPGAGQLPAAKPAN